MTRLIIYLGLLLFLVVDTFAANPAIIYGAGGRALTIPSNGIELSSGVIWYDLSVDPTSVAVDAPQGSFGAFGANLYVKQDAGSSTNWTIVSLGVAFTSPTTTRGDIIRRGALVDERLPLGTSGQIMTSDGTDVIWADPSDTVPLMARGSLVTSDGTNNGEFAKCDNGDTLEWDDTNLILYPTGIKCVTPSSETALTKGQLLTGDGASNVTFDAGADGELIVYDSGETTGLSSQTFSDVAPITTEGDVIIGDASGDSVRLGLGASGYVLKSNGTTVEYDAPPYLGLFGKGSILTSNGLINGEFTACGDGEILEWDTAEAAGIKCVTKPSDSNAGALNYEVSSGSGNFSSSSTSDVDVTNLSVTITTAGNPVRLYLIPDYPNTYPAATNDSATSWFSIVRDATKIAEFQMSGTTVGVPNSLWKQVTTLDTIGAGTYTYKVRVRSNAGNALMDHVRLVAIEQGAATPPASAAANYVFGPATGLDIRSITNVVPSYNNVPNLTATITTTGNPVEVSIVPAADYPAVWNQGPISAVLRLTRGGSPIHLTNFPGAPGPIAFSYVDTPVAGTYTYNMQEAIIVAGSAQVNFQNVKLYVKEIK